MATQVYFGLGSNLGDKSLNINRATELLGELLADANGIKLSSLYKTEPDGFTAQSWFLNAACSLSTDLDVFGVMSAVFTIQSAFESRSGLLNSPREIDIDILMYGDLRLNAPGLIIPHPRMAYRDFVLAPLAEIAPQTLHPVFAVTIFSLLTELRDRRCRQNLIF